jgi:hypothetical protein
MTEGTATQPCAPAPQTSAHEVTRDDTYSHTHARTHTAGRAVQSYGDRAGMAQLCITVAASHRCHEAITRPSHASRTSGIARAGPGWSRRSRCPSGVRARTAAWAAAPHRRACPRPRRRRASGSALPASRRSPPLRDITSHHITSHHITSHHMGGSMPHSMPHSAHTQQLSDGWIARSDGPARKSNAYACMPSLRTELLR